jgi:2'-5' RNA ligase
MTAPLIVTLGLDARSQARFQAARDRWFPPDRNVVPAHLTLFHQLPGDREWEVAARLAEVARGAPPMPMRVTGILSLGKGAAYRLEVFGLDALRARIAAGFDLSEQDRSRTRPHVTVQNKVGKEAAREAVAILNAGFVPWDGEAVALDLWRYLGGPWQPAGRFGFGEGGATEAIDRPAGSV